MDYLNLNMGCIKTNRNSLYLKLKDKSIFPIMNNRLDSIESVEAKDGQRVVVIRHNLAEHRLNSIYRPMDEAKRWAQQYDLNSLNNIAAMFGFGNGIFARAMLERLNKDDYLFIYEPCYDIFNHVLHNYDICDILKSKKVILGIEGINDLEFHLNLTGAVGLSNLKSQLQCIYPNYDKIFPESCLKFYHQLKDTYTSVKININTMIAFGEKYIDNTLKNIQFIPDSSILSDIREHIPEGIPAVIVAAGPSVQDDIDVLKKLKGRAVVFAVDKIFGYLMKNGIEPDFVVTLDPKKNVKYFTLNDNITTPLICFYESNHDLLLRHKGKKIFCTSDDFTEELYIKAGKESPDLMPSGSVAIIAYSACIKLGFKRIVLVGQDLAYRDGFSHAGGVMDKMSKANHAFVEGLDGQQIESRYDWKEFITRYQDLIAVNKGTEVIDTKKQGAKIKGTVLMPLEEVLSKYCTIRYDSDAITANLNKTFSKEDLLVVKRYLQGNIAILRKIKEKSINAEKICDSLIKKVSGINRSGTEEDVKKITKINKYIEEQKVYSFMDSYISGKTAQHLAEIFQFSDNERENELMVYKRSISIYRSVVDAVNFTKERLENAIEWL